MPISAYHHIGLRVQDIDRSARFYIDALGARWLTMPAEYQGELAEVVMGGIDGAHFKAGMLGFDPGVIELFEFITPKTSAGPDPAQPATERNILHWCVQVDDVRETLARIEEHGGKRHWPKVESAYEGIDIIYVTDPDGNVIELISGSPEEVVASMIRQDPAQAPGPRTA